MSNNVVTDESLALSYQNAVGQSAENSGVLQEIPAELLREVAGALMENPR